MCSSSKTESYLIIFMCLQLGISDHLGLSNTSSAQIHQLPRERVRKGRVEEWEGLKGDGSEQEKRRGNGKWRTDGRRGKEGDFQKFQILTASMLCSANLHYHAKFRAGRSSRSGDMAVYWIFQDGGRPPSWIFKSWKLETGKRYLLPHL